MSGQLLTATPEAIAAAADALKAGKLVAFPTETVYGLGADAESDSAVAGIFAAKNRPTINPLIVHVADLAMAERLARFDGRARQVAAHHWPGPLTLVLPRQQDCPVSLLATAGLETLAIRLPNHPIAAALLHAFGGPIAAPSANPSGRLSPTDAAHVADSLGASVAIILDGGATPIGLESTIVDLSQLQPLLLRPGGLAVEEIERLTGPLGLAEPGSGPRAPGMLASHYAPRLPIRLNAGGVGPRHALLAFGAKAPAGALAMLNLSAAGDLREAAANLFAYLRRLDASGADEIAVMTIPEQGLGRAINDRLRRAAAPRPAG
ncbi:MAG TPA: L-threonylcarbamoyladenylate synthase [Dongiaceae bacterium]|jgi:L-threonylcarbamoyladenylate synthase|nr:L-threonylcarbamoyladenylate synthase [Dongiaceae bacterium]